MTLRFKNTTFLLLLMLGFWSCSDLVLNSDGIEGADSEEVVLEETGQKKVDHKVVEIDKEEYQKYMPYKEGVELSKALKNYCKKVDRYFAKYKWGKSGCENYKWHHVRNSVKGDPLFWVSYGNEAEHKTSTKNMTLILCGVHGDEITPIKFCFDIMRHLNKHFGESPDKLVAIAPIANPDSFFKRRPTRTNYRGVDVNRNFPTKDWFRDARRMWKRRYRSDKRRNPGKRSLSEPETLFQVNLIKRYRPAKIITVHSPLTILDYDGPNDDNKDARGNSANALLLQMSKKAKGYRVKNYPFFPGSLGNYAGNERKIPTYTLELPSSDPSKSTQYWDLFKDAIHSAVLHDFRDDKIALDEAGEISNGNN